MDKIGEKDPTIQVHVSLVKDGIGTADNICESEATKIKRGKSQSIGGRQYH
jgi:hypothetical protein